MITKPRMGRGTNLVTDPEDEPASAAAPPEPEVDATAGVA